MPSSSTRRRRSCDNSPPSPSPPGNNCIARDYSALPREALLVLFSKIPHADILRGAGLVCTSWRKVAIAEPALWQHIDLATSDDKVDGDDVVPEAMVRAAVDYSAGQCESFRGPAAADLLVYLAERSPSLMSIHVTSWFHIREEALIEGVIKKLPVLERLVVSSGYFDASADVMRAFLSHCPRLELLDVGGCYKSTMLGYRVRERCKRAIKVLRLPKNDPHDCRCCIDYSQRYADEHDE
ncbi:hypothetical protein QOZ80_1BG0086270 [Eleusine coracana subsp. coracana]|nr:hypothetical protein QOZ80_1BG0086270 [Eleusine coracana subsp. coracana]